ncbi:hypothetical protein AGMMS50268_01090 [Spirochaetia bacterium]|nr:hypothetical protein AGMMS50268_01090 [Spirochaetia bacterium]
MHEGDTGDYSDRKGKEKVGLKIDKDITAIRACFANNELTELVFPDSLSTIADGAFSCNLLKSVKLPKDLEGIGSRAFMNNCLESIVIPNSVRTIGAEAFRSNSLKVIKLSKYLDGIGNGVFMDNKLESIVLPAGLKWISDTAFKGNPIVSITIGENLEGRDSDGIQSSIPYATAFGDYGAGFIESYIYNSTAVGTYEYNRVTKKWRISWT